MPIFRRKLLAVIDLFSFRKRVAEGEAPDVFVYNDIPNELRVQIVHIWRDAIGISGSFDQYNTEAWDIIHGIVAREKGLFELADGPFTHQQCEAYLLGSKSVDDVLDIVEVSFRWIDRSGRELSHYAREGLGIEIPASEAIEELNKRFMRAGVGYQFEDGIIFRVDSGLLHSEVVKPVVRYLQDKSFSGPRDEFLSAHAHYRAGGLKEAITDANKAFESALKAICNARSWEYPAGARASDLVAVVRQKGLLPDYLERSFEQLAATLKTGLPQIRNQESAHGQGPVPRETPDYVAAYALHLAAAKILFLVKAHKAME